jgi:hypothetical protein
MIFITFLCSLSQIATFLEISIKEMFRNIKTCPILNQYDPLESPRYALKHI